MIFTPRQEKINEYLIGKLHTWANDDDLKAIEKIVLEGINWKELRKKFFAECTDKVLKPYALAGETYPKINIAPSDLFEWFKKEIQK